MNSNEHLADLASERGAVIQFWSEGFPTNAPVILIGAAEILYKSAPRSAFERATFPGTLFYFPASVDARTGKTLPFTRHRLLHALCHGFYDNDGKLIALVAQIRERELGALIEQQLAADFTAWRARFANPALQRIIGAARATAVAEVTNA